VPAAFTDLQRAIDAAPTDQVDTLKVTGTCTGNFIISKSIAITSSGAHNAVISGIGTGGRPITIEDGGAAHSVRLTNLTISGGNGAGPLYGWGGGIRSSMAQLTLDGTTTVTGNTADAGGGIHCNGGQLVMAGTARIERNTAMWAGGVSSCQLSMSGSSAITGNSAVDGGGLWIYSGLTMSGASRITGNTATHNGGGVWSYEPVTDRAVISRVTHNVGGDLFSPAPSIP
jgi:cytoskeletal protein CcmA (bactofilin family)